MCKLEQGAFLPLITTEGTRCWEISAGLEFFFLCLTVNWELLVSHADTCNSLLFSFVGTLTSECVANTVSQISYFKILIYFCFGICFKPMIRVDVS